MTGTHLGAAELAAVRWVAELVVVRWVAGLAAVRGRRNWWPYVGPGLFGLSNTCIVHILSIAPLWAAMTFTLDTALGFVVGRTFHIQRRAFKATVRGVGIQITPEEWVLLNRLWTRDGQRQSDLAESTIKDRTTVTRLLDGMVKKGLVRRETDPEDRRVVLAWLTDSGKSEIKQLLPTMEKLLKEATTGISESDLEITRKTLTTFQTNLGDVLERTKK